MPKHNQSNTCDEVIFSVKSIIVKKTFRAHPEVKSKLWGGNFGTSEYYVNTVSQYG